MKILAYPLDKGPYQERLYFYIIKAGNKVSYMNRFLKKGFPPWLVLPFFPIFLLFYRFLGFKIFHLHWQSFNLPLINRLPKISLIYSIFCIKLIKIFGFKLLWTVHNLIPHEKATSDDLYVTKILCDLANAKIVHSDETINEMKKLRLNTDNTFIIPHGSFVGVYPNNFKNTKNKFGFLEKDFVFLFFGNIRPYKGLPELLNSFSKLKDKRLKLLIVGNCWDNELINLLKKYSKIDKRILTKIEFVKDEEIQNYINACDIEVFPFRKITTTSSVISAASFKKPFIAPRVGNIKDMPSDTGIFYNPQDKKGLLNAMEKAINLKDLKQMGENGYKYAKSLSWKNISKKTIKVYKGL